MNLDFKERLLITCALWHYKEVLNHTSEYQKKIDDIVDKLAESENNG